MARRINSFQFRLFLILALVAVLIIGDTLTISRLADEFEAGQNSLRGAHRLSSIPYLLTSLIDRTETAKNNTELEGVLQSMRETIANFDQIDTGFRNGDANLHLDPIQDPETLSLLDDLDHQWAGFRSLFEQYIAEPDEEARAALVAPLYAQSITVSASADHFATALDLAQDGQQQTARILQTAILILTGVVLAVAIYVVLRANRSIRHLAQTAEQLAGGDLKARANVNTLNEIAQVGSVFNQMAERVEQLITTLEDKVRETEGARAQAEQANQVKSAFLASMSHELRTPLNSVINFSKFVIRGTMGPVNERQTDALNRVVESGTHLLSLINDVLDMSKIESGSLTLFVENDVNLNDLLRTAASTAQSLIGDHPVKFNLDVDPSLPIMSADRQRILQILLNMVSNACKFTKEGSVTLSAHQRDGEIWFSVQDTGPGIAPEDHAAVFEPFRQTETGVRQGGGTGLGMPISKRLAEAHDGRMWLESAPGKGATFTVVLPITTEIAVAVPG